MTKPAFPERFRNAPPVKLALWQDVARAPERSVGRTVSTPFARPHASGLRGVRAHETPQRKPSQSLRSAGVGDG
jgi:hypothetical protein